MSSLKDRKKYRDPVTNQLLSYSGSATSMNDTTTMNDNNNNDNNENNNKKKKSIVLVTSNGAPIMGQQTSALTASTTAHGSLGPIVLQDFTLLDHIAHFDRERIPERVVHAKGAGAFGYFELTSTNNHIIQKICRAKMFQPCHNAHTERTPIAIRFSTVGGESGSSDTVRDPRGFAIKFYTKEEGNWDIVGNNTPIFFIRDPILFPSFIHTQKRNPVTNCKDPDMFWDFISLRSETIHQVSLLFSNRGIPDGYRHMNGYGSHTFVNVNELGEIHYVKYHFKTDQGIQNLQPEVAQELASSDPEYATRDLYNAIAMKQYPSWTMYIQIMTPQQVQQCIKEQNFNPFDVTKVWSHTSYPLHEVGRIVLNENPTNYFTDIEQLAFSPANMIPGIGPSPDRMLQGRLFSYPDTQRYRLGPNYTNIPVNQTKTQTSSRTNNINIFTHFQRDGAMQTTKNGGNTPNYYPNSFQTTTTSRSGVETGTDYGTTNTFPILRSNHQSNHDDPLQITTIDTGNDDNYSQCCIFYCQVLNERERDELTTNIVNSLCHAQNFIQQRMVQIFYKVHEHYGKQIEMKLLQQHKLQQSKKKQQKDSCGTTTITTAAPLNPPRFVPPVASHVTPPVACPYAISSRL